MQSNQLGYTMYSRNKKLLGLRSAVVGPHPNHSPCCLCCWLQFAMPHTYLPTYLHILHTVQLNTQTVYSVHCLSAQLFVFNPAFYSFSSIWYVFDHISFVVCVMCVFKWLMFYICLLKICICIIYMGEALYLTMISNSSFYSMIDVI